MGLKEWLLNHVLGGVLVAVTLVVLTWAWPLIGIWGFALGLSLQSNAVLAFYYVRLRKPKAKVVRRYTIPVRENEDAHPVAFRVQLERIPGDEEPRVVIASSFLCGEDHYRMLLVGTYSDGLSDAAIQEWACPHCAKKARIPRTSTADISDYVKSIALGRFHNGEPSDPSLQSSRNPR